MKKRILLCVLTVFLTGCGEKKAQPSVNPEDRFLKDDNGLLYTEDRLTAENTFRDDDFEDNMPCAFSDLGRNYDHCLCKIPKDEASAKIPLEFIIGCALVYPTGPLKDRTDFPYLYYRLSFPNAASMNFSYKAAILPKFTDDNYSYVRRTVNGVKYYIFDTWVKVQIDFSSFYDIVKDTTGHISFGWEAPIKYQTSDYDSAVSETKTYQFTYSDNGAKIKIEKYQYQY